jgi:hypothetical protein
MRLTMVLAACAASLACGAAPAAAAPTWAPAADAAIHPGVNTTTGDASCTSNFIFRNRGNVLIGQAAHCSGTGASTETDGCKSKSLPEGTAVTVDGAKKPGKLVYNSWIRMQARGEKDPDTCAFNDLALVKLSKADAAHVNPSIPEFGGPVGLSAGISSGGAVFSYGNSAIRQGISLLSPKRGIQLGDTDGGGWNHTVITFSPGIPGDSGSAFLDSSGGALGILSTLDLLPTPGTNGVGDLGKELAYAKTFKRFKKLRLAKGTEPFTG